VALVYSIAICFTIACTGDDSPGSEQDVFDSRPTPPAGGRDTERDAALEDGVEADAARPHRDAGVSSDAGSGFIPLEPGTPTRADAGAPGDPPSCPADAEWGEGASLLAEGGELELRALSADERTVLFVDLLDATHIWLSDRENAEAAFGAAVELPLPVEANLEAGLAVSPDGLDVVFIEGEFARLGMLRRESRAAEFVVLPAASAENPAGNPLTALNSQLGTIGARGTSPVYHPLGAALYFNQYRLLGIGETALIGGGMAIILQKSTYKKFLDDWGVAWPRGPL
jgi:hypothetical protein